MKKKLLYCGVSFLLIFSILTLTVSANNMTFSWYCKRTKDHSQPPLPSEFNFISEYDCYYISHDPNDKTVYLTFDAGYENGNIEKTLDILNKNQITSAFFVLSNLIDKAPDIVKRMIDDGHTVCNHSSTHKNVSKITDFEVFERELTALENLFREKFGREISKYFRPPEGRFSVNSLSFAKQMGYKTVFWSFAYADWDNNNQMSPGDAKKKIIDNIHNGAVILLHPTSNVNVMILDDVIKTIKGLGYRFGSLDELTAANNA